MKDFELLYIDQKELNKVKKQLDIAAEMLNKFVRMTVRELGELDLLQITELPTNGIQIIKEELKGRYQFPKANNQFNLEALGIAPDPLYKFYSDHSALWQQFEFFYVDGEFKANDEQVKIKKCYYYADTPERIRILELARKTIDLFKELKDSNLVDRPTMFRESFTYGLFSVDQQDNLIVSHYEKITSFLMKTDRGLYATKK